MILTPKFTYAIIEDAIDVCNGIKTRMDKFEHWRCVGDAQDIMAANKIISIMKPQLLFMDWDIKGSNTFHLLQEIKNNTQYNPYIIYFTAFQNDEPQIPEQLMNNYEVNKYLVKPIWKRLTSDLENFLTDAISFINKNNRVVLKTFEGELVEISFNEVIYCAVFDSAKRTKSIVCRDGKTYIVKLTLNELKDYFTQQQVACICPNETFCILNANYIKSYKKPTIFLNYTKDTFDVSADNIKEFEEWWVK